MIGYVSLGTNDLPRAAAFYDALLAEIGAKRLFEFDRGIGWGVSMDKPSLGVMKPFDGQPATRGNGNMVGIPVDSAAKVDSFHAKAISLGAADEGAPGPRAPVFTRPISATSTATNSASCSWVEPGRARHAAPPTQQDRFAHHP
jgi:catechol 2,3-dioxygenase-like lactoylglutathione lyase family enzyme